MARALLDQGLKFSRYQELLFADFEEVTQRANGATRDSAQVFDVAKKFRRSIGEKCVGAVRAFDVPQACRHARSRSRSKDELGATGKHER